MNKTIRTFLLIISAASLLALGGCNIFDFSGDDGKTPVEKAEEHIRHGRYAQAKQELAEAISDSVNSEALYYAAKATILEGGFDIADIISNISVKNPVPGLKLALLEFIDQFRDNKKTNWFVSNVQVVALLGRIWYEKTTGTFGKDDIAIDYTIANMMTGILKIRDPNGDYQIDFRDFQVDLKFFRKPAGYITSGFKIDGAKIKDVTGNIVVNNQGLPVILKGLSAFVGDWGGQASGVAVDYRPDDINKWLESTLSSLYQTESLISEMELTKSSTSFNIDELKQYNRLIAASLNNYWYNDGIDNDGDGLSDEEDINGIDDDADGLIDEDTRHHPADTTPEKNNSFRPFWQIWIDKINEG